MRQNVACGGWRAAAEVENVGYVIEYVMYVRVAGASRLAFILYAFLGIFLCAHQQQERLVLVLICRFNEIRGKRARARARFRSEWRLFMPVGRGGGGLLQLNTSGDTTIRHPGGGGAAKFHEKYENNNQRRYFVSVN